VRNFYEQHGIDGSLFRIIPNAIEPRSAVSIDREEAYRRLEVPSDHKLILAVGRLWSQKRYRDLIWAAELLATLREDITLVIVGDGPQRGELLRFRDAVTRPDRVRFAGNRSDVQQLLPHADLFWIGSEYEGQSNALMEAMQAGVAAVASDIPGNRDLVLPNETGRLVELGDTADFARQSNFLLDHQDDLAGLGEAARQRITNEFTVDAMVQKHVAMYEES
jgi:glycosyltransferase involved in cell wall biosynthesis